MGKKDLRRAKVCQVLSATFYYTLWAEVGAVAALNMTRPTSPEFLSSLVMRNAQPAAYVSILVTLGSSVFQAYLYTCIAQNGQLWSGTMLLFMFPMADLVSGKPTATVVAGREGSFSFGTGLETGLGRRLRLYRQMQLLTDEYNGLLCHFSAAVHTTEIVLAVMCVCGAVRTEGVLAFGQGYLGFWSLMTYLQIINSYAEINRRSKLLLRSLRTCCRGCSGPVGIQDTAQGLRFRRELKSLKELRIRAGSYVFFFDKQLVLNVIGIVLVQSINVLILD